MSGKQRWLLAAVVALLAPLVAGCSVNKVTVTPEQEKAWRNPPPKPPAGYRGPMQPAMPTPPPAGSRSK